VVGATTMIFSLILMLQQHYGWTDFNALSITSPQIIMGMLCGGAVVYWFCGASMQAVTTGAYRAVSYIKQNIKLDGSTKASAKDSNEVVRICTKYAQYGMINIFIVIFCFALGFAFVNPIFFIGYLIAIALFGLFAAIYMANAGGCWDNAKKLVEVELKQKGTPLHDSTVVGDLVGDPFKDTSSVALNPIIKFTTLFGILAVEIAIGSQAVAPYLATLFIGIGLVFVLRSFYGMRIPAPK
jgi:K(+)-stimulated pyrophosphate-energized sodium pump